MRGAGIFCGIIGMGGKYYGMTGCFLVEGFPLIGLELSVWVGFPCGTTVSFPPGAAGLFSPLFDIIKSTDA